MSVVLDLAHGTSITTGIGQLEPSFDLGLVTETANGPLNSVSIIASAFGNEAVTELRMTTIDRLCFITMQLDPKAHGITYSAGYRPLYRDRCTSGKLDH